MRDTFEWIDGATKDSEQLRHALYDLAAHQIASQALSVAIATRSHIDEDAARELIELVAMYPEVTGRRMTPENAYRISDRAVEILMRLARMKPGFVER
jgi:hypothetical protein